MENKPTQKCDCESDDEYSITESGCDNLNCSSITTKSDMGGKECEKCGSTKRITGGHGDYGYNFYCKMCVEQIKWLQAGMP